ncbi:MAG TPA: carboxypeptidase-like regulatory domain-containing protein [Candidatus Solibacter sp.]|jgi:hypothetical protein|nr:carboxypeptidase-like regulatory domain-containing protein [Candidatus Solibacter sp.]
MEWSPQKEGDGYPDSSFGAFAEGVITIPEVKVEEGKTTSGVVVELKKGGVLAGVVSDSETGKPLAGAILLLARDDDPRLSVSTRADIKGRFQLDLPAKPFNIRISQPGYATWENGQLAPNTKGPPLVIEAGSRHELIVVLKKMPE